MPSTTLNVRGIKLRTQTQRRYVVVMTRTEDTVVRDSLDQLVTYLKFAYVEKRSDNIDTARKAQRSAYNHRGPSCVVIVFDTTTGEEV